uniref:Uncharacterized protein n=1 Tax=Oryza rufipogon TaxID=4529 RepID=A0A0E0QU69_ORYRU
MSSSNIFEDDEIEAAFAAGAMPPEWRRRLVASGQLDERGVDKIAADIAAAGTTSRPSSGFAWSKGAMAFAAFDVVVGALLLCLGVAGILSAGEHHHGDGKNAVVGGLLVLAMTAVVARVCEYERRRGKMRRLQARIVLERSLLPPV